MINLENKLFEVPLKDNNDYDFQNISYSKNYNFSQADKDEILKVVKEIANTTQKLGEKSISTSIGQLKITYDVHPRASRMKFIQGFLVNGSSKSNYLLSILHEFSPERVKTKPEGIKHLEIITELVEISEENKNDFNLKIFEAILDILLNNKEEFVKTTNEDDHTDTKKADRLANTIDSVKKLY